MKQFSVKILLLSTFRVVSKNFLRKSWSKCLFFDIVHVVTQIMYGVSFLVTVYGHSFRYWPFRGPPAFLTSESITWIWNHYSRIMSSISEISDNKDLKEKLVIKGVTGNEEKIKSSFQMDNNVINLLLVNLWKVSIVVAFVFVNKKQLFITTSNFNAKRRDIVA